MEDECCLRHLIVVGGIFLIIGKLAGGRRRTRCQVVQLVLMENSLLLVEHGLLLMSIGVVTVQLGMLVVGKSQFVLLASMHLYLLQNGLSGIQVPFTVCPICGRHTTGNARRTPGA